MSTPRVKERPAQRPDVRPETAPAREEPRARTRQRNNTADAPTHDSYINFAAVPPDVSLEWKRFSAVGQEYPYYLQAMRKQGWEPVNPREHPDWVTLPPGYDVTTVIVDGLILMERPLSLTIEARQEADALAKQRIIEAEQRLGKTPEGEMTRNHAGVKPRVVKEIGRMAPVAIEE